MKKKPCVFICMTFLFLTFICLTGCSARENTVVSGSGYEFSIPGDFTEVDVEGFECFYSADDGSSINLNIQPADPSFDTVSAELLNNTLTSVLSQTYHTEIAVAANDFSREPICGYPAYQYSVSYSLEGDQMNQTVIGVQTDKCYTLTYTDMTGDWADAFEESIRSIRFFFD